MRFYACTTCRTSFQILGDIEELKYLWSVVEVNGLPSCPTPLCQGKLIHTKHHVTGFVNKEVPLPIFFRGIHGFGSPDGEAASLKKFKELITTKKIIEVRADSVGQPERVILKRLVLEDGTRLHFDSSTRGACCYYIEQPGPSCLEAIENELIDMDSTKTTFESSNQDREEARRVTKAEIPIGELGSCAHHTIHGITTTELPRATSLPSLPTAREIPAAPVNGANRHGGNPR